MVEGLEEGCRRDIREVGEEYNQNALCTCMKLSKDT